MLNFIASWRREREAIRELSRLTDRELADLGIARSEIRDIAAASSAKPAARGLAPAGTTMAPSWGAHLRGSVAA